MRCRRAPPQAWARSPSLPDNREHMLRVLGQHPQAAARIDEELVPPELLSAAQESWDMACELGERYGVRNSQAKVLCPTGTIGLMMDRDTTGIEPDLGLVKMKKLVGGGTMSIVNQTVPRASSSSSATGPARTTSSPTSTSTSRSSAPRTCSRSTYRCSPARWATTPSTTRAT